MPIKLKPLSEQVIVITGASSGIGLVTARMAAKRGAKLVLAARNEDAIIQLAEEIAASGGHAVPVTADVGREEDVARIAQAAITDFGGFDTWVNNAGVSIFGRIEDVPVADMHRMFQTNFWGVAYGSLVAVRHFRQSGGPGALINVGSFFGDRATPVQSAYSASKHAVHGWTDALRMELEAEKAPISVTLIHPGRIDTPYNEHAQNYMPREPAHRGMIYAPEAVADAILFAAEHPKRDLFVGFQSKAAVALGVVAPRLTDKIMEQYMFWSQQSSRPSEGHKNDALYQAGYGMHERGTHEAWQHPGKKSLYVQASKYPLLTALAVAGTGIGVAAALGAFRKQPMPQEGQGQDGASGSLAPASNGTALTSTALTTSPAPLPPAAQAILADAAVTHVAVPEPVRESGQPSGGQGRVEDVRGSGIYPADAPSIPGHSAIITS